MIDFHPILPALQPRAWRQWCRVVTSKWERRAELKWFTVSVHLSSLTLTSVNMTPLPLHPVTMMTSQPPRSVLRCVPLTDSCFTPPPPPLVFPQPKTHSLSASSMQDPSAHPGEGLTYPPSLRTTSTSCCKGRPGCSLPVTRPRSPTWLRLGTRSSLSPLSRGVRRKKRGNRLRHN